MTVEEICCAVSMLMSLWCPAQIHTPYSKPGLIGCCYRPPSLALCYLDELCTNIDRACFYFRCPLYRKLSFMTRICHLSQIVDQATRLSCSRNGSKISTCIFTFTNVSELSSTAVSRAVGCSDHKLIDVPR